MSERSPDEIDRRLLADIAGGDHDAFARLVVRHERRALALAQRFVRHDEDAREVVQDAFLRVWLRRDQYAGQATVSTWLYRIIHNLAVDLLRRRAARPTAPLEDRDDGSDARFYAPSADEPDVAFAHRRLAEELNRAVQGLPPHHRAVITLREVEGLSYAQIAQRVGVARGTVMSRLFHARRRVQRAIGEYGDER